MTDIFREVDEDVRRERAAKAWAKYQTLIIGVAVLIVAATAGWRAWDYYTTKQAQAVGARYEAAVELDRAGKTAEAEAAFKALAAEAPAGYRSLALLKAAAEAAQRDKAEGVKAFEAVAADAAVPALFQDAARLRAALLRLDEADQAELARRLEPLAEAGKPLRHTAREMLGIAALKSGDLDRAAKYFDQIVVDSASPATVRQRADLLLGLVRAGKPSN